MKEDQVIIIVAIIRIYIMALATSQVEKHFQMHSIYKRSRAVYDVEKMNESEHKHSANRRKPTNLQETLDTRVDSSFMNASDIRNQRLNKEISQFKKRYHNADEELEQFIDLIYGGDEEAKLFLRQHNTRAKGLDWSRTKGRSGSWEHKPIYNSQDRFNNFTYGISPQKPNPFTSIKNKPITKIGANVDNVEEYDCLQIAKISDRNKFDNAGFRCLVEYDRQDRYKKDSRSLPPISIDSDRIVQAKKLTSPCTTSHIHEFYHSASKQSPSQMAIKLSKDNQFYYRFSEDRSTDGDIGSKLRKEKMEERRKEKLLKKRAGSHDARNELCDEKYFRRQQLRMPKQRR